MTAVPHDVLVVALGLAIVAVLAQVVAARLARWSRSRRARVRAARAGAGEREAAHLLTSAGYDVEASQVSLAYDVVVDGAPLAVPLRADYLVRREGRRYVAEVKTGEVAPRLATAATRRQLLEYLVAFDVDGVLLVDAEAGAVHEVRFGLEVEAHPPPAASLLRTLALVGLGLALGLGLGAALTRAADDDQAAARASSVGAAGTLGPMPFSTQRRPSRSATGLTSATQP